MLVLGISDSHNSTAALYEDGRLVAAVAEERLRRVKNWMGFPRQAVEECLRIGRRDLGDVDYVALTGLSRPFPYHSREAIIAAFRNTDGMTGGGLPMHRVRYALVQALYKGRLRDLYRSTPLWKSRDQERWRKRIADVTELGVPEEKVAIVEHHFAHASAAYYGWAKFDEDVLVLTNDGGGDGLCATVNIGRGGRLERIADVHWWESVGMLYAMTTCVLGMVPLEHEYKVMGMAPYAETKGAQKVFDDLKQLFEFDGPDGTVWKRRSPFPESFATYNFLRDLFELRRFDWICGGLQQFIEDFITRWVRNCIRATGIRKVALSGGLFMNIKLNKAIMELPEVEDLFVFPSCGDETNSIGSAYNVYAQHAGCETMQPLRDFYTGAEYDDEQVGRAISGYSFRHETTAQHVGGEIEQAVADLLARGEVVARFSGREEFGARAMGNRSILADPSRPDVVKVINDAIKSRDFWMPFAPSMLDRRASDYFVNPKELPAPYMIMGFDSTDRVNEFRAACHPYDLTVRPQVVYRDWNPRYYSLLENFEAATGRGILLNTSFNLHGYPIVSYPEDALRVLDESGLNWLAIGNHLLHKEAGG
ncbi:MAG TPA: carbamoyltransferase C-terminal domain-containing protein [Pyrinomonadaceae bacterium]|nr:carbamoyltransferase C-terminal domain-containing protein [Pyrinomonadaceae bacterium]